MYCIVDVVYGIPLNDNTFNYLNNNYYYADKYDDPDDVIESMGITNCYSGSGMDIGYFGIKLDEFDEATEMALNVNSLKLNPTSKQIEKVKKMYDKLPEEIKKLLPEHLIGIYFVFYTN